MNRIITSALLSLLFLVLSCRSASAQFPPAENDLDRKVIAFLKEQSNQWRYLNIPMSDGRILYDLVLKGNYKKAVEIGTSTGHSGVWIAWALSKTGGKLITIEIDKGRHEEAVANFKKAGVEVNTEGKSVIGRHKVSSLTVEGRTILPKDFLSVTKFLLPYEQGFRVQNCAIFLATTLRFH